MIRLVVLGDPVEHSRSPAMHRAALEAAGLKGIYEARQVDRAGMVEASGEVRTGDLTGANITMPHKRLAAILCDVLEGSALRSGSVNTWARVAGRLVGYSTDGQGIRYAWERAGLPDLGPILVLGSGGAAAAALVALEAHPLYVSARRPEAARTTASDVGVSAELVPWGSGIDGAVVVNATPVGMRGENLPEPVLDRSVGLLDMPYDPGNDTPAVTHMRATGRPVAPGVDMLVGQAMASFRLWTGIDPSESAMRAAL